MTVDNQPYLAQLQRIEQRCQITILEAIADRGYGSAQIIRTLQEQGKRTFIPLWSGRVGNSKYLRGNLVYQKEHDRFQCPAGKYLTPTPAITENHKRYVASSADCRACAQASTCPARRSGSSPKRFVLRSLDQDLFEEVQARMRDPTFRTRRSERMWKMEGLFAEAKQNHRPVPSTLSRAIQGPNSSLLQGHRSESEAVGRCAGVLADHTIPKTRSTTSPEPPLLPKKPTYSTGPNVFRHANHTPNFRTISGNETTGEADR
jgi:hypothetical protein